MIRHCAVILWTNGEYEGIARTAFNEASAKTQIQNYARSKELPGFKVLTKAEYHDLPKCIKHAIDLDWKQDIKVYG